MKYIVQIFVAALVLWMSGSSYWYVNKIKGASFEKNDASASDINIDASISNDTSITTSVDTSSTNLKVIDTELEELTDEAKQHLVLVEQTLRSESKMVFFKSAEDEIEVDDELRSYISDLNLFMNHHGDQTITLIGHTDNIGGEKENNQLGLHRAEFIKKTLVGAGIQADQIHTVSKGENNPISKNETEKGRSEDRRVEIIMN
jgi:outer membrane protein OmpA-like peptidoglycan-associated protein